MLDPVKLDNGLVVDRSEIEAFVLSTNRMFPTLEPIDIESLQDKMKPLPELKAEISSLNIFFIEKIYILQY